MGQLSSYSLHITPQVKFVGFMGEVASYHVVLWLFAFEEVGGKEHLHHYFLCAQLNHQIKIEAPRP